MDYSYSFGHAGLACPEIVDVTVTAIGGNPREVINHRNQLQLQFLISSGIIHHCSYRIVFLVFWKPFCCPW